MFNSFCLVTSGMFPDLTLAPAFGFAQIPNKGLNHFAIFFLS